MIRQPLSKNADIWYDLNERLQKRKVADVRLNEWGDGRWVKGMGRIVNFSYPSKNFVNKGLVITWLVNWFRRANFAN